MKVAHVIHRLSDDDIKAVLRVARDKESLVHGLVVRAFMGYAEGQKLPFLRCSPIEVEGTRVRLEASVYDPLDGVVREFVADGKLVSVDTVELSVVELG